MATTPETTRIISVNDVYNQHNLSSTPGLEIPHTSGYINSSSSPSLATSEADPNVSYCLLCDKSYAGPNARSILRRHKSEKHGIALSQQRKGTRWDKDPNRPRSEAERRERTLESKRRYAQRRRRQLQEAQEAIQAAQEHGIAIPPPRVNESENPFKHNDVYASRAEMFITTPPKAQIDQILPHGHIQTSIDTPAALAPITNFKPPTTPKKAKTDLYKLLNSPLPITPDSSPIHSLQFPKLPSLPSSPVGLGGQENMPRLRSSARSSPRNHHLGRKAPPSSPLAGVSPYATRQIRETVDAAAWSLLALHKTSSDD